MPVVRLLIGVVTGVGLAALIINTIVTGRDIPAGLLTLLTTIIGAIFGVEALQQRGRKRESDDDDHEL